MQLSSIPAKIAAIFAASASSLWKNTVPLTQAGTTLPGQASFDVGFPSTTMQPLGSGGILPFGQDFNGILNAQTAVQQWQSAGGSFPYDSSFSSTIGGYPKGAVLLRTAGTGFWLNTADNNTTNPETGGAGWLVFAADWTTGADTGSTNAAVVTYTPIVTALTDRLVLRFKAAAANTGATTLNVNGLGAKALVGGAHSALQGGEIVAGGQCTVVWNATLNSFVLIECTGGAIQIAPGSAGAQAIRLDQFVNSFVLGAGYAKLPGGLIIQWGYSSGFSGYTITFPVAFPNGSLLAVASGDSPAIGTTVGSSYVEVNNLSNTSCRFYCSNSPGSAGPVAQARAIHWLVIGY